MLADRIAAHKYRRALTTLEHGDLDRLLADFAEDCTMTFAGDTPLGADGLQGPAVREWFERFLRLLPERRFEIRRLVIAGPPWRQRLAAHVTIRAAIDGQPYENQFAHFLLLRWGKVADDLVLEDTQRLERACRRLAAAGITEADAPPIT